MASTWGDSWGVSWGVSWDIIVRAETVSPSGSGGGSSGGGVAVRYATFPTTYPPQAEPWEGLSETRQHPTRIIVRARVEISTEQDRRRDRQHPAVIETGNRVSIDSMPSFALQKVEQSSVLDVPAPIALIGPLRVVNMTLRRAVEDLAIIGMT